MFCSKQLFIFDLDGTLVDAYQAIADTFNFTMRKLKLPAQKEHVIHRAVGRGDTYILKMFVAPGDLASAIGIYRKRHAWSLTHYARLMPQAKNILLWLKKKKCLLAVASNRPTKFTRILLKTLGLYEIFDKISCADKLRFRKPHPMILNNLIRSLGVSKENVFYVGDMALDVKTGQRAGVTTVAVATGSSTRSELRKAKPVYLFYNLEAFKKKLESMF